MKPKFSPLEALLPYQQKWVFDEARFKIGVWSRQTGKSFLSQPMNGMLSYNGRT